MTDKPGKPDHVRKMAEEAAEPHRFAKAQLKAFVERIERLHEERKSLGDDVRDVYAEAKGSGYSTRAIKHVVKIRAYDREHGVDARHSEEAIIESYLGALGLS